MNESRKKDMTAISSWKKKLKNVKGLSKDVMQQLSQLPTPVVTSLINQIGMIVAGDEDEHPPHVKDKEKEKKESCPKRFTTEREQSVNEARLMTDGKIVTNVSQVLDIIANGLKKEMGKRYKCKSKRWSCIYQLLAKMVGMTATDKKQIKNRMFLKMGDFDELDEGLWDNIRKKKARIKAGSGERMRKKGEKGAPTPDQIRRASRRNLL